MAQLGHADAKKRSSDMVLEVAQLPGDRWIVLDQRSWRTGVSGIQTEEVIRAREAGSWSWLRSFQQSEPERWLWLQVVPFASSADAHAAIASVRSALLPNPRAKVSVEREGVLDGSTVGLPHPWVFEQQTKGPSGVSNALYVADTEETVLYVVACSSLDGGWEWPEVGDLAALQSERIRARLGPNANGD